MSEEKQIGDPPPLYAQWVRADDQDATDARVGRLWRAASPGDREFWADLVEVLDKLKAALADAINPTAEDYDHAAEILKLREVITEVLAEFGQHYCDDPACESAVRIPTARLTRWRERAGLADL